MTRFTKAIFSLLFFLTLCNTNGYSQIVLDFETDGGSAFVDYNNPKKYEVGGITTSGSGNYEPRLLYFAIGSSIEIPGDAITKSVKRLWSTGTYEDINISISRIQGNVVFIDIYLVERARLVAFSFRGSKKSEETDIRAKIKISQGNIVNDNLKITSANIIRNYYIDKGFFDCKVDVSEEKSNTISNGVNLHFDINKGKKVRIEDITISGNKNVSEAVLTRAMKETRESSRFRPFYQADKFIKNLIDNKEYFYSKDLLSHLYDYASERIKFRIIHPSKFNEDKYEDDKIEMIKKYNELGFRDAFIKHDTTYLKHSKMYINMDVVEGKKYYFRNINFVGNTKYKSDLLRQLVGIEKGDVYNLTRLNQNLTMNESGTDLSSLYMNDGYLFFYANPVEVQIDQDSIDIEIRIKEGKQARYNKVYVTGNNKTNDNVIMREITTIPGHLFNRADIVRTQQVLLSLGYFNQEKMNVIPKPNEADGTVDIEYVVEEASSDQFELSIGYGAQSVILSAGITFNNFSFNKLFKKEAWSPVPSGDGQRLALKASTNARWYQYYILSFTEPWLGGKKPNSLTFSVNYQRQSNGNKRGSTEYGAFDLAGASVSFAKKLKWPDDYFQMAHTIQYQYYKVTNYSVGLVYSNGHSNNLSYTFILARNSVDAPIYPRSGSDIMFSVQLTPPYSKFSKKDFSQVTDLQEKYRWLEFHKWKFNLSWFTRIVENLVLNVRMKVGFMGSYNKDIGQTPFERFYLGGDGLSTWNIDGREVIGMRGYGNDDLTVGPNGVPSGTSNGVGGTAYNKFTAEIRYPISLNPSATIFVLAFVEAGKTWLNIKEYSPFNLYKSAGAGIRLHLPMFGLLGFDWGWGFDALPGQQKPSGSHFHISINSSID
ncbi:MAG: BamA/TamA family outer membrane protein [Bacteroidales bacterium]|jgi:outer membrane protein insertion porin family|nr:BamA/TamA family outer membrane protein [Bacteroidales bacterium]